MCICATVVFAILVMDSVGAMDAVCGNCSACDECDACVGCDACGCGAILVPPPILPNKFFIAFPCL